MCRGPRIKNSNGIFHIMIRSISEITLFRNCDDKNKFLEIVKKYQNRFLFKVYGFCLMDTHVHLLINCNGADISKFMHNINQCYALYYNKKYDRHGHVFGDRFKSIQITNDKSLLICSAYIHNNPKDIKGFKNSVEEYKYSSFAIYTGKMHDRYGITNTLFLLERFGENIATSRKKYYEYVKARTNAEVSSDINFDKCISENNINEYRSEKVCLIRKVPTKDVIEFICNYTQTSKIDLHIKYRHISSELRSVCAALMRSFCDFKYKEICGVLGNITLSNASVLCNKGYFLIQESPKYKNLFSDFLAHYKLSGT